VVQTKGLGVVVGFGKEALDIIAPRSWTSER